MKIIAALVFAILVVAGSSWAVTYSKTYRASADEVFIIAKNTLGKWYWVKVGMANPVATFDAKKGGARFTLTVLATSDGQAQVVVSGPKVGSVDAMRVFARLSHGLRAEQRYQRRWRAKEARQEGRIENQEAANVIRQERLSEWLRSLTVLRADAYRVAPRTQSTTYRQPEQRLDCTSDGDWDGYEIDFTCDNTPPATQTVTTEHRDIYEALATRDGRRYVARCEYTAATSDPTAPMAQAAANLGSMIGALLVGQRPTLPVCAALNVRGITSQTSGATISPSPTTGTVTLGCHFARFRPTKLLGKAARTTGQKAVGPHRHDDVRASCAPG
jgi:hypothetical protein